VQLFVHRVLCPRCGEGVVLARQTPSRHLAVELPCPRCGTSATELAEALSRHGLPPAARALRDDQALVSAHEEIVDMHAATHGARSREHAVFLAALADVCIKAGRAHDALAVGERALALLRPDGLAGQLGMSLVPGLYMLYLGQGMPERGHALLVQVVADALAHAGPDDLYVANHRYLLARSHADRGEHRAAIEHYEAYLAVMTNPNLTGRGMDEPATGTTLTSRALLVAMLATEIAKSWAALGDRPLARSWLERARAIWAQDRDGDVKSAGLAMVLQLLQALDV
jgi:ribosomal protein S27AE